MFLTSIFSFLFLSSSANFSASFTALSTSSSLKLVDAVIVMFASLFVALSKADTLIIGGTSLIVYPAAALINYFRGNNLILINKTETTADRKANLVIRDSIGKVLSSAVELL